MPFVKGRMEQAHRDICRKVIEKVEMQRRQNDLAKSAGRGQLLSQGHTAGDNAVRVEADANETQSIELPVAGPQKIL